MKLSANWQHFTQQVQQLLTFLSIQTYTLHLPMYQPAFLFKGLLPSLFFSSLNFQAGGLLARWISRKVYSIMCNIRKYLIGTAF